MLAKWEFWSEQKLFKILVDETHRPRMILPIDLAQKMGKPSKCGILELKKSSRILT